MITKIFGENNNVNIADCDTIVQIVFKDLQHYLEVKSDPHYLQVVNPDHANFADPSKTQFVTGWWEAHILNSSLV